MAQKFQEKGYEICEIEQKPDIVVVNTCTVTNIADRIKTNFKKSKRRKPKFNNYSCRMLCSGSKRKSKRNVRNRFMFRKCRKKRYSFKT